MPSFIIGALFILAWGALFATLISFIVLSWLEVFFVSLACFIFIGAVIFVALKLDTLD